MIVDPVAGAKDSVALAVLGLVLVVLGAEATLFDPLGVKPARNAGAIIQAMAACSTRIDALLAAAPAFYLCWWG